MSINKNDILSSLPAHFSYNSNLRNFRKFSIFFHRPGNNRLEKLVNNYECDTVLNKLITHSQNTVFEEFRNKNKINFIDNIDKKSGWFDLVSYNKKFMVSSHEILLLIATENFNFNPTKIPSLGFLKTINYEGILGQTKVFVDYLFKDNLIFLFDKIEVSFEIETISNIEEEENHHPWQLIEGTKRIRADFLFDFNIVNPHLLYIIDSKKSEFYPEFISDVRDKMIDGILY
jgi:hypothetical protein